MTLAKLIERARKAAMPDHTGRVYPIAYLLSDLADALEDGRRAAADVCAFDWSDNDDDAVATIDALRKWERRP